MFHVPYVGHKSLIMEQLLHKNQMIDNEWTKNHVGSLVGQVVPISIE